MKRPDQKGVDLIADVQDTIRIRGDREIILIILRNLTIQCDQVQQPG